MLLDLDDTVLDFKKAEKIAISHTLLEFGIEPTDEVTELYSRINKSCWERLESGEWTRDEVLVKRFEILFDKLNKPLVSALPVKKEYERRLGIGHYFIDGAEAMLKELSPRYRLFITSNGTERVQAPRIKSAGIKEYFEQIFISEKMGAVKPSAEFFDIVFSHIDGFCKDETIIIGDSLTSDILGGVNAGIKTCWFNPHHRKAEGVIPDYEIHSLDEVAKLLLEI